MPSAIISTQREYLSVYDNFTLFPAALCSSHACLRQLLGMSRRSWSTRDDTHVYWRHSWQNPGRQRYCQHISPDSWRTLNEYIQWRLSGKLISRAYLRYCTQRVCGRISKLLATLFSSRVKSSRNARVSDEEGGLNTTYVLIVRRVRW